MLYNIIIWHYNPLWVFALSAKSLQVLLSLAISFQFLSSSFFKSSITSSFHRCLGLPTGLIPIRFQSTIFFVGLAWSIPWICPSHLIHCALMNLTVSAPSINLSISMFFFVFSIYCQYWQDQIFVPYTYHLFRQLEPCPLAAVWRDALLVVTKKYMNSCHDCNTVRRKNAGLEWIVLLTLK